MSRGRRERGPGATSTGAVEEIASECLAVRLRMLNRRLTRIYDDALRPHGVGVAQVNLLVAIASLGHAQPSELVVGLGLDKSTLSRNVSRLADRGWVAVWQASDGRGQLLTLSEEGDALLEAILPDWRRAQADASELLGKRLRAALAAVELG